MKKLNFEQMEKIEAGSWWACAASIAGAGLFVASLFVVPGEAVAVAMYATSAAISPTIAGIGIATSC